MRHCTREYSRLSFFLEQLENASVWRSGYDRFSWQSSIDLEFLKSLRRMSCEMSGVLDAVVSDAEKLSNKAGLISLKAFGLQGADFVVADAGTLAEVYANPREYKVLLSLEKLIKTVRALSADAPPALLNTLKKVYRADRVSVAIERFKASWLDRLSQLEVPVYWHLFCPPDTQSSERQQLVDSVAGVLQDLQQELATPHLRAEAIKEIKAYCDARAYLVDGEPDAEHFQLAWNSCYGGL
jgi:hypothetical protein